MGQNDKKVAALIDSIAHKRDHDLRFPVMSGKVISVDETKMVVKVELSVDDEEVHTEGININVVLNNMDGMYGIPAVDSYCLVGEIDGPGKWELLKASKYTKIYGKTGDSEITMKEGDVKVTSGTTLFKMKDGKFVIKSGSLDLKTIMDNILNHIVALTVPTGTGPSGPPINIADFNIDKNHIDTLFSDS